MSGVSGVAAPYIQNVITPGNIAFAITAAQSGSIFNLPAAAALNTNITLPALQAGLNYSFVFPVVGGASGWKFTSTGANITGFQTSVNKIAAILVSTTLAQTATATDNLAGDTAYLMCNGTGWSVQIFSRGANAGWGTA